MGKPIQLEEALVQIDLLERKLSESMEKESDLLRIIGNIERQIFSIKKNSEGEYVSLFSEGKIAKVHKIRTEQVEGKTIREIMGEEPFSRLKPYYDRAFSGEIVEYRGFLLENRYYSQSLSPLKKDQNGEIIEIVGVNQDITDTYLSEIENQKNTDVLNKIIEYNPYSIQILNAEGYHIRENKAFLDLFKTVPDKKWSILKDQQLIESGLSVVLRRVMDGYLVQMPPVWYNVHLVDPTYPDNLVCIGSVIFPVFLSDGKLEYIVLMHEDVTDRMEAREALKNNEQPLKHLLSSNPAVIYTSKVVPPYEWTFISDNVLDLTGYTSVDFLANQNFWTDHVHPDDRQKVIDELPLVLEKGSHILEYRFRRKDGSDIWIQGETKLIGDSQGNPQEIIGYWIDITKRKQADHEFMEAKVKAEESDRLKSAFLANMSHEVRTPLNSIIGFSELLADPYFEEAEKTEFIQHIIANGNNLLSIISDIMDVSKMDSGEFKMRKSQINAHQFTSKMKEQFAKQAETKKLELQLTHPDNGAEIVIFADADRLNQIFNNLISNALKFTENGKVVIGYQAKNKMIEFFVKDTGIGIPAEYHDKIFERFRQVEISATRKFGGNGLGLAISKNLVELMGGKIWLESESGKGSVFYFTLPRFNRELES